MYSAVRGKIPTEVSLLFLVLLDADFRGAASLFVELASAGKGRAGSWSPVCVSGCRQRLGAGRLLYSQRLLSKHPLHWAALL